MVFGGEVQKVLLTAIEGRVLSITSVELLQELEAVLKSRKFNYPPEAISTILYEVQTLTLMVHPKAKLNVIKSDPPDNRVLECAVAGKADWIVSGDSDLLELGKYRKIKIYSPRDYLDFLNE